MKKTLKDNQEFRPNIPLTKQLVVTQSSIRDLSTTDDEIVGEEKLFNVDIISGEKSKNALPFVVKKRVGYNQVGNDTEIVFKKSDSYGGFLQSSLQSPFTKEFVGGHQFTHNCMLQGAKREGWEITITENSVTIDPTIFKGCPKSWNLGVRASINVQNVKSRAFCYEQPYVAPHPPPNPVILSIIDIGGQTSEVTVQVRDWQGLDYAAEQDVSLLFYQGEERIYPYGFAVVGEDISRDAKLCPTIMRTDNTGKLVFRVCHATLVHTGYPTDVSTILDKTFKLDGQYTGSMVVSGNVLWVDNTNPLAADSALNGSETTPFSTIAYAYTQSVVSSSIVIPSASTYTFLTNLTITNTQASSLVGLVGGVNFVFAGPTVATYTFRFNGSTTTPRLIYNLTGNLDNGDAVNSVIYARSGSQDITVAKCNFYSTGTNSLSFFASEAGCGIPSMGPYSSIRIQDCQGMTTGSGAKIANMRNMGDLSMARNLFTIGATSTPAITEGAIAVQKLTIKDNTFLNTSNNPIIDFSSYGGRQEVNILRNIFNNTNTAFGTVGRRTAVSFTKPNNAYKIIGNTFIDSSSNINNVITIKHPTPDYAIATIEDNIINTRSVTSNIIVIGNTASYDETHYGDTLSSSSISNNYILDGCSFGTGSAVSYSNAIVTSEANIKISNNYVSGTGHSVYLNTTGAYWDVNDTRYGIRGNDFWDKTENIAGVAYGAIPITDNVLRSDTINIYNILSYLRNNTLRAEYCFLYSVEPDIFDSDYNTFLSSSTMSFFATDDDETTTPYTLSEWQAKGYDAHSTAVSI
jgi:hypothetical protein